jgi:hypothetical protein
MIGSSYNSLTEIQLTYYKVYPLKAYNSKAIVLNIFRDLFNHLSFSCFGGGTVLDSGPHAC